MVVDVATGARRPVRDAGFDGGGVLAHDGKRIALAVPRHDSLYFQLDVSVRDLAGGRELQSAAAVDRNVHWFEFAPDDKTLLVATADGVRNVLWRYPLGGTPAKADLGDVDFAPDATLARDGSIAFVGQRRDDPDEIYVLPANAAAPKRLTNENAFLADYALARRDRVDWTSDDGTKVDGVLTYPIGYQPGKKYPLVLDIHGGPVSRRRRGISVRPKASCARFSPRTDTSCCSRTIAAATTPATRSLRDRSARHQRTGPRQPRGRRSAEEIGDRRRVAHRRQRLVRRRFADGLARRPRDVLARGRRRRRRVRLVRSRRCSPTTARSSPRDFLGASRRGRKEGRAAFDAESPITYADAIRTPLLIISDTGDQRVPITQSYALYHALRDRGRTVKFIAFPRTGHFPTDPVGRESVLRLWTGWFDRWMK